MGNYWHNYELIPLFTKYLSDLQFIPYKELNKIIKDIQLEKDQRQKTIMIKEFKKKLTMEIEKWQEQVDSFVEEG